MTSVHETPAQADRPEESLDRGYLRHLVGHLSGLVHIRSRELFKALPTETGLTPKQSVVMEFIARNQGVSQREIAIGVVTTPAMVVGVLDVLESRGLVERVVDSEDRRRTFVQLTAAGVASTQAVRDIFFQVEDRLQADSKMTREEWETLVALLRKITERGDQESAV